MPDAPNDGPVATLTNKDDRRESLAEQAYAAIRVAINAGQMKPGERVVARELAEQLQIGRTPLREALIKLQQDGLVDNIAGTGLVVASVDERDVREFYAIGKALEGYATAVAAATITRDELERLRRILEEQRATGPDDRERLQQLNVDFHQLLYSTSGMTKLLELILLYRDRAQRYHVYDLYTDEDISRIMREHDEILGAVERRDSRAAELLMRQHISAGEALVVNRRVAGR